MKNHYRIFQRVRNKYILIQSISPPDPYDEQPEYDEDEIPDYALDEEDSVTEILNDTLRSKIMMWKSSEMTLSWHPKRLKNILQR